MSRLSVSAELAPALLEHLEDEAQMLAQVQACASQLTAGGYAAASQGLKHPELAALLQTALQLDVRRADLKLRLSGCLQCSQDEVRLSLVRFDDAPTQQSFHLRRRQVYELAVQSASRLNTAQWTLGGWHSMISALLSDMTTGAPAADRYSASGQRVTPTAVIGVDMRS